MIAKTAILLAAFTFATVDASGVERLCPVSGAPARKGSPSCWVSLRLERDRAICLSRDQWSAWLRARDEGEFCGDWSGKWKEVSPPANLEGESKRTFWRFAASELPKEAARETLSRKIERAREWASTTLAPHDRLGISRKLLLNEDIPSSAGSLLWILGFVHLLTIAGVHLYALSRWIESLARHAADALGVPARFAIPASRGLGWSAWAFSWVLNGCRPGMLRPLLIVAARSAAKSAGFRWRLFAPLMVAIACESAVALAKWHFYGTTPSWSARIHYALAVGGGLAALELELGKKNHLVRHALMALGSWLPVACIEAWTGGTVAVATPLISLVTLPVFTLVFFPWMLACVIAGNGPALAHASGLMTECLEALTRALLMIEPLWVVPHEALLAGCLIACVGLVLKARWPALVALALLARFLIAVSSDGRTEVIQLDVGQGDSALVLRDGSAGLIDAGSERGLSDTNWIKALAARGVSRLDWVALTHLDEDHAGGMYRLAKILPIGCVATARTQLDSERGKSLALELARAGVPFVAWESGCFPHEVLPPGAGERADDRNGGMSALLVPLSDGAYLNAGDASVERELAVAKWVAEFDLGPNRILKISHHGSRFSTPPELLDAFRPTEAWISSGVGNRYGHPARRVLTLLEGSGVPTRRTDQLGALSSDDATRGGGVRRRPRRRRP